MDELSGCSDCGGWMNFLGRARLMVFAAVDDTWMDELILGFYHLSGRMRLALWIKVSR